MIDLQLDQRHLEVLQAHHDRSVGVSPGIPVPPRASYMRLVGNIGESLAHRVLKARYPDGFVIGRSQWLYRWNRKPGPRDEAAQVLELSDWKDRFDLIDTAVEHQ